MGVKYKDYYEILGVSRTASQDELKSAYRKLAKENHPDVSKKSGAEERFKEISEAYEVLRDPEKRKRYDMLGSNWQGGQDFTPPPGWGGFGGQSVSGQQVSDFSDFFEQIFGGGGGGFSGFGGSGGFGGERRTRRRSYDVPGDDHEVRLAIPLEDAFHGAERTISIQVTDANGRAKNQRLHVKIPKGVAAGQKIRLAGQGGEGEGSGRRGDLYLIVDFEPHEQFRVGGRDLFMDLPVAPWEAALGAGINVTTLGGEISLTVPAGTSSGQKLRLKAKGLPNPGGAAGDLYVEIRIVAPKKITDREKEIWESLAKESTFNPRASL